MPEKSVIAEREIGTNSEQGETIVGKDLSSLVQFASLVELSGVAIVCTTADGVIVSWNPAAEQLYGYSATEVLGKHLHSIMAFPDYSGGLTEDLQKLSRGETLPSYETVRLTKSGKRLNVSKILVPLKGFAGEVIGILVIMRDIGSHKKLQEELVRLAAVVESSVGAIFSFNVDGMIKSCNPAATAMTGYAADELIGQSLSILIAPERRQELAEVVSRIMAGETAPPFETMGVRKDGTLCDIFLTVFPVKNEKGRITGISCFVIDITEKQQTQLMLRRQTRRLEAINRVLTETLVCETEEQLGKTCLDVAEWLSESKFGLIGKVTPEGVFTAFAISESAWRCSDIDPGLGYALMTGIPVPGIFRSIVRDGRSMIINSEATIKAQPDRLRFPKGHPPISSFIGIPLIDAGQVIGVISLANKEGGYTLVDQENLESLVPIVVEAIKRKRAQELLTLLNSQLHERLAEKAISEKKLVSLNNELIRARDEAEKASRAKSMFLATMSHEIRTPLNAVIGMTDLVLKSQLTTKQRELLMTVRDSGETLLSVISDILDFSRIEAGKLQLEPGVFDVRENLGNTIKSFAIAAHGKNLELTCFIHPDVPRMVIGDYNRLRQIVVNLVGNAIKFTDQGDVSLEVALETRRERDVMLHFMMMDTGVGIPEEKRDTVFQEFVQADGSTSRRHGGTGLGLAIVSRLVKLMGGRVWYESRPEGGSCFHFTVALDLAEQDLDIPAAGLGPIEPGCLDGARVLVVDDNATNRYILKEILGSWKMTPCTVASAWEALSALQEAKKSGTCYQLVIADAHMTGIDGFALAEEIRRNPSFNNTVVMMLTSADSAHDIERCKQLGVAAYLLKPIKQSELLEAIQIALNVIAPERRAIQPVSDSEYVVTGLRILVAEDSLANQQLALAILERQGHNVTIAGNGKEAVREASGQTFDLVLMDVQMPEMDGFEATALIRAREKQTGAHVPIIAMTAHAQKSDRDRCLDAGMDFYISKPIHAADLLDAIETKFFGAQKPAARAEVPAPVDWSAVEKVTGGDRLRAKDIVQISREEIVQLMGTIRQCLSGSNCDGLRYAAHTLKASGWYCTSSNMVQLAQKLEDMACKRDLSGSQTILTDLESETNLVIDALSTYLRQG